MVAAQSSSLTTPPPSFTEEERQRLLGIEQLRSGNWPSAGQAFKRALALAPSSEASQSALCELLATESAWPQLATWSDRRQRINPSPAGRYQSALGLLRSGAHEKALTALRKTIAEMPAEIPLWMLTAEGSENARRTDAACVAHRRILALAPANRDLWGMFTAFLERTVSPRLALARYERYLTTLAAPSEFLIHLTNALVAEGRTMDAIQAILTLARNRPDEVDAPNWLHFAAQLAAFAGETPLAVVTLKCHAILAPDQGKAYGLLSETMRDTSPDRALALALRFIATDPMAAEAHGACALALKTSQRLADVEQRLRQALALAPGYLAAIVNLSQHLLLDRRAEGARRWAVRAMSVEPSSPPGRWNLGQVLLTQGEVLAGLDYEENRLVVLNSQERIDAEIARPRWRGEPLGERSLLIWLERGIGDQLYYLRWLAMMPPATGQIIVECDERLATLLRRSFPHLSIVAARSSLRETLAGRSVDLQIPIGSLPLIFKHETADAVSSMRRGQSWPTRPYLFADRDRERHWDALLSSRPGRLRVAISWRSGLQTPSRNIHYLGIAKILAILRGLPITVVNVQYDTDDSELAQLRTELPDLYLPTIDLKNDFDDIAALLKACDLLIAPAIAITNLAMALGIPTWCCLLGPDWMNPDLERHPLFPNQRHFMRGVAGSWDDVAKDARAALVRRLEHSPDAPHMPNPGR